MRVDGDVRAQVLQLYARGFSFAELSHQGREKHAAGLRQRFPLADLLSPLPTSSRLTSSTTDVIGVSARSR